MMNIDFENALTQEPVQAVMMVIMRYLTDEQRKIVWEKLGRRVDQSLPGDKALEKEAEKLYPTWPFGKNSRERLIAVDNQQAYIKGRHKSISIQKEMGQLLMDKDGQIEALKNEVAERDEMVKELEERIDRFIIEKNGLEEELALYRVEK